MDDVWPTPCRAASTSGASRGGPVTWPARFVAFPTSQLMLDEQLSPTDKATQAQLRAYVKAVPGVYARLQQGATPTQMLALRSSPSASDRAMGEAYFHMFSPAGREHRIEAEYTQGVGVIVTRGRHRVHAAQHEGLTHLPVHLRAPDRPILDSLVLTYEQQMSLLYPSDVQTHRQLEALHRPEAPGIAPGRLACERTIVDMLATRPTDQVDPQRFRQRGRSR